MVTTSDNVGSAKENSSPIEKAMGNLFGKIDKLEQLTGKFIGKTALVRIEAGVQGQSLESKASSPMSPLEIQIDDASEKIDMIAYRVEQALAELRL